VRLWPARRRLVVHAGLHKTGSTAVQAGLAGNAAALAARRWLVPASGRPDGHDGHHNIAWELTGDARFRPDWGTVVDLAAEIGGFAGNAIVSSEDFEGALTERGGISALFDAPALRRHGKTVVVYVRDQAGYAESLFAEMQDHGMTLDAASFVRTVLAEGAVRVRWWRFHFDYAAMLAGMRDAGLRDVVVRPYAGAPGFSVVGDLFGLLGCGGLAEERVIRNPRAPAEETVAAFCARQLGCETASVLKDLRLLAGPALAGTRLGLRAGTVARLRARFAAGNAAVARRFGFDASRLEPRSGGETDMETLCGQELVDVLADWRTGRHDEKGSTNRLAALLRRARETAS
jgi:hypothetical protein